MKGKVNDMRETKLLPCPFCGGEAVFGTVCRTWIKCKKCGYETEWTDDAQWLVDTWNTRKPMDDIVERLKEHKSYNQMMLKKFPKMGTIENAIYKTQRDTYKNAIDIVRNAGKDGAE